MNPARDTSGWPAHEVVLPQCICNDGFGLNLSCRQHGVRQERTTPVKTKPQASGVGSWAWAGGLVPSNVVCAEQQTCIDIANAAIRLLEHFKLDIERGGMVAAEKSRHEAFEMVRQLGPAWLDCWEKLTGCAAGFCEHGEVVELCDRCGDICFGEEA